MFSKWHLEKIRVAKITYNRERRERSFYKGYIELHRKFISIESGGSEPDYDRYYKLLTQKYYDAKNEDINYWAGGRYACVESRSKMKRG